MMCVTPVNISDEKLPPYFFKYILSVALVVFILELSSKEHKYMRPRREKTCLLGFRQSESQTSLLSLTG